jgi:hypothetical protein
MFSLSDDNSNTPFSREELDKLAADVNNAVDRLDQYDKHLLVERLLTTINKGVAPVPMFSTEQAASLLGVSNSATIRNWLEGGYFPGAKFIPNVGWQFSPAGIRQCIETCSEIRNLNTLEELKARGLKIPRESYWLYSNPVAMNLVRQGLADAKAGRITLSDEEFLFELEVPEPPLL